VVASFVAVEVGVVGVPVPVVPVVALSVTVPVDVGWEGGGAGTVVTSEAGGEAGVEGLSVVDVSASAAFAGSAAASTVRSGSRMDVGGRWIIVSCRAGS
jgi:hypothetical protein